MAVAQGPSLYHSASLLQDALDLTQVLVWLGGLWSCPSLASFHSHWPVLMPPLVVKHFEYHPWGRDLEHSVQAVCGRVCPVRGYSHKAHILFFLSSILQGRCEES